MEHIAVCLWMLPETRERIYLKILHQPFHFSRILRVVSFNGGQPVQPACRVGRTAVTGDAGARCVPTDCPASALVRSFTRLAHSLAFPHSLPPVCWHGRDSGSGLVTKREFTQALSLLGGTFGSKRQPHRAAAHAVFDTFDSYGTGKVELEIPRSQRPSHVRRKSLRRPPCPTCR